MEDESITGALSFDDFEAIGDGLIHHGWAVMPSFLPAATALALAAEAQAHWQAGAFRQAGVGRGAGWVQRPDIRSDEVFWVEEEDLSPTLATTLGTLDALKQHLNRSLFAGLEDFEVHLARYGRGAFYARHIDQFEDTTRRAISVVLYLNHQWRPQDGGALRLWTTPAPGRTPPSPKTPFIEVLGLGGVRPGAGVRRQVLKPRLLRFGPKRAPWWSFGARTSGTRCGERGERACR